MSHRSRSTRRGGTDGTDGRTAGWVVRRRRHDLRTALAAAGLAVVTTVAGVTWGGRAVADSPAAVEPVPLVVDTDLFSSTDDAAALAVAFALQARGEAKVLAVGINTRTNRPAVATDSWRCAAAIARYYGAASTPIGTAMPNDGTEKNTIDWVAACAQLAPASAPVPDAAVRVFRQALAGQPDGSVVVVSTGYLGNLAALLASPADEASPADGLALVSAKVKALVVVGGGFPQRDGENNLRGDPVAAQAVASTWPTRIVWSGYEVGDLVHTGNTLSVTHPPSSPLRAAYEAFVGPGNWMYSYDETAVYHAVRSRDPVLLPVGPGVNVVDDHGGNAFVAGPGNQQYLTLGSAEELDASLESLLAAPPPVRGDEAVTTTTVGVARDAVGPEPAPASGPLGPTVSRTTNGELIVQYPASARSGSRLRLVVVNRANREVRASSGWTLLSDRAAGTPRARVRVWGRRAATETHVHVRVRTDGRGASAWVAIG